MDNSERNIHFQGFAKLLWDEISHNLRFLDFGFNPEQQASIDNHIREIVAQRAYDLACHVLYETSYGMDKWDVTGRVNATPDLTQWPTPPEP